LYVKKVVVYIYMRLTECVAIANLCSPAPNQVHLVLGHASNVWVPSSDELNVLIHLIRLHLVKDDRVYIFASSKDLGEGALNVFVEFATFLGAIDKR